MVPGFEELTRRTYCCGGWNTTTRKSVTGRKCEQKLACLQTKLSTLPDSNGDTTVPAARKVTSLLTVAGLQATEVCNTFTFADPADNK